MFEINELIENIKFEYNPISMILATIN